MMAPHLILFVAGLTSVWAMLSIIGGERERVLQNAELLRRAAQAEAEAAAAREAAKAAEAGQAAAKNKPPSSASFLTNPAR